MLLTGPTGSGKSTLLRTINGLIPHASAGSLTGNVQVDGQNVSEQPLVQTCRHVSLLFQEPDRQLFCTHVEDEIAFGLENLGTAPAQISHRIDAALQQVGLPGFRNRRTAEISSGEKQRVALACLCAMRPRVLLLDEPTSYLNPRAAKNILDIVKKLNLQRGITVLLATHRTAAVASLCNRVWLLHNGTLTLNLPRRKAFLYLEPYRRLGVQPPQSTPLIRQDSTDAVSPPLITKYSKIKVHSGLTSEDGGVKSTTQATILKTQNLTFTYPNAKSEALKSISCEVNRAEVIAIMGENGSGKTTLIHLITGLLRPTAGEILLNGETIKTNKLHQFAGKVGIVFQNPDLLLQAETVGDEVAFGLKNLKLHPKTVQHRLKDTLSQFDIHTFADEPPYALSRGQRQRVAVAAISALQPDLLLLDEPTTGQDVQHSHQLMNELCQHIQRDKKTLIFTTHDPELTLKYAHRVLCLHNGQLIFDGTPEHHKLQNL